MKTWPALMAGVEKLAASGGDVSKIASVASFFISRIDAAIEKIIEGRLKTAKDAKEKEKLQAIDGKVAIANGKLAYQSYLEIFGADRWKKLAAKGAKTQRVLWASTGTKNPKYRDVLYVEEMVGPGHGEYHSSGDFRRLPRPRRNACHADRKCRRGKEDYGSAGCGRHLHERSHREVDRRWCAAV